MSDERDDDERDDERTECEQCARTTRRVCARCGARICRRCATNHLAPQYGDPRELWKPCRRRRSRPTGDCFRAAGRLVAFPEEHDEELRLLVAAFGGPDRLALVHGVVTGTAGPVAGIRYAHAWAEIGDLAVDRSNGHDVVVPTGLYYAAANAEPVARYDRDALTREMLRAQHWGPWQDLGVDR